MARDLAAAPRSVDFPLSQPVTIAGITYSRMHFTHYCYDQSMAPQGKSSVVVVFETSYPAWKTLADNRDAYEAEKHSAAQQVIDRLDWRFPGFRSQVEVVDVATPLTYERYTGSRQGSPQGWQTTPGNLRRNFPQKLPGLASLYMAGQWAQQGGGIPGCARSGYNAVRLLCRDLGQPFHGI